MRGGADVLRSAGIEVVGGIDELSARDQNPAFFHRFSSDRPFLTLKLARSLDGAIADERRVAGWLTGAAARREVHRQRADHAAIAVGVGTVVADDPQLTVRGVIQPRVAPTRVVFDRTARIPLGSALVRSARETPVIVMAESVAQARRDALADAGVRLMVATGLSGPRRASTITSSVRLV